MRHKLHLHGYEPAARKGVECRLGGSILKIAFHQNGQVQLMAHARAAFASQTNGSMKYPFTMLFHVELA